MENNDKCYYITVSGKVEDTWYDPNNVFHTNLEKIGNLFSKRGIAETVQLDYLVFFGNHREKAKEEDEDKTVN